jgi:succinate-semialdehyde dehydrogenase/glutarate-semialdehyde dehydrogenase
MAYQTINPYNGEVLRTFDELTDEQLEAVLTKADNTFRRHCHGAQM